MLGTRQTKFDDSFWSHAVDLLNQQFWCWGRDVLRAEGNWLLEVGFDRTSSPSDVGDCPSLYTLRLPQGRCIILRGFGLFYGKENKGGVFLPRFEFFPQFTREAEPSVLPWTGKHLPSFRRPSRSQRSLCAFLTLEVIDWIRKYEIGVMENLGVDYRYQTLAPWDDGEKSVIPAEAMASTWRWIGSVFAETFHPSAGQSRQQRTIA